MADNYQAKDASGTSQTFGADDISSVYYPRVKVGWGADGAINDTSAAAPLPVVQTGTPALPTGASSAANQTTIIGHLDGVEGLLTTIDADTSALAGAISGTEVQVDVLTLPASTNTLEVVGDVAHDAAAAGNPLRVGAKAETALSGLTLVADGDTTDLYAGVDGVLITRPHANLEDIVSGNASNTDGTSTSCIAAQGAGIKTYLTMIVLTNTSATGTYCEIKDGATTKLTIPVPANGGAVVPLPVPIGGTANTAWNFDPGAATTTMYCSLVGFKSKI